MSCEPTVINLYWDDGNEGCIVIVNGHISKDEVEKIIEEIKEELEDYSVDDFIDELEEKGHETIAVICYDGYVDVDAHITTYF